MPPQHENEPALNEIQTENQGTETAEPRQWGVRAIYLFCFLGLGWGGMVLFGYHWVIVDFASAPFWSVVAAFVAMPVLSPGLGWMMFDKDVIFIGLKAVLLGLAGWAVSGWFYWLDPILLAAGCGVAALILVVLAGILVLKEQDPAP